jgi:REP element-mobilizing transposase RayT
MYMSRPLRIEFPGAIYHITSRGDRRENIFLSDDDRKLFLEVYSRTAERFGWICYAYCLMSNHYHLVMETPLPNLSSGMAYLNGTYTQKFNRKNKKVGHVFQGRYKAVLVERNTYLLELLRYVVLNPVRAKMVTDPGDWLWSSYNATVGTVEKPEWLNTEWILNCFSENPEQARNEYRSFVSQGMRWGESIWDDLKKQIYLGSDDFIERVQEYRNKEMDLEDIPKEQVSAPRKEIKEYLLYSDRREGMARAYLEGRYSMREIGRVFGVHGSTVSRAVKEWESKSILD